MRLLECSLIFILILFSCKNEADATPDEYVLLKEIFPDEGAYTESDMYFDKEEVVKISSGLIYYGVAVKVVNDSIYITKKHHSDMNYLYNIQQKCKDSSWYASHIVNPDEVVIASE